MTNLETTARYFGLYARPLNTVELAELEGVSHQAIDQRIRRILKGLAEADVAALRARRSLWKNLPRRTRWDRFWERVRLSRGCWNYWGTRFPSGYGHVTARYGSGYAHRAVYEYVYGSIPNDMSVCHKCDNPSCVRPDHLFLGNHKENMVDRELKGRGAHWKKGPDGVVEGITHGRYSSYINHGCRCESCRDANRAAGRNYRARRHVLTMQSETC